MANHPASDSHGSTGLRTNPSNYSWINSHPWITSGWSPLSCLARRDTPPPIHQSFQGRAEQAHKPTHLGWVLKTQAGALHPSSSASFSTDVFGLLSSLPDDLIREARPRAVPQGLPKSPLRPAPGPAAAPAFPAAAEDEQRRGRWPSTLPLDHRGRRCPAPWPLPLAAGLGLRPALQGSPARRVPAGRAEPSGRAGRRAVWPAAYSRRFPSCGSSPSSSSLCVGSELR